MERVVDPPIAETIAFVAAKKERRHDANPKDETARLLAIAVKVSVTPEIRDAGTEFISSLKDWYTAYDKMNTCMADFKRKNMASLPCKMPSDVRQSQLKWVRDQIAALKGMWEGVFEIEDHDFEIVLDMGQELDAMSEEKTAYAELLVCDRNDFRVQRASILRFDTGQPGAGDGDTARLIPQMKS